MTTEAPIPQARRKLERVQDTQNTLVCVGLDSEYGQLPELVRQDTVGSLSAILNFNRRIVGSTQDLVCAYKPNMAFYEGMNTQGLDALELTMNMIGQNTDALRILDFKRGDIGNTNRQFIDMAFDRFSADAVTVNAHSGSAYMENGEIKLGSLAPFLEQKDKLIFVWNKSSNPDGGEWQDQAVRIRQPKFWKDQFGSIDELGDILEETGIRKDLKKRGYRDTDAPAFLIEAYKIGRDWNISGNVGLVVGATYPQELSWVRKVVGDIPILVPGLGAQEGDAKRTIEGGLDSHGRGAIINAARSIIFASKGEDFAEAARESASKLRDQINQYRQAA